MIDLPWEPLRESPLRFSIQAHCSSATFSSPPERFSRPHCLWISLLLYQKCTWRRSKDQGRVEMPIEASLPDDVRAPIHPRFPTSARINILAYSCRSSKVFLLPKPYERPFIDFCRENPHPELILCETTTVHLESQDTNVSGIREIPMEILIGRRYPPFGVVLHVRFFS